MEALQQIRDKRADLARQRTALDRQDAELAIAEKVLAQLAAEADSGSVVVPALPDPAPPAEKQAFHLLSPERSKSRRERVLEALSGEMIWMTSGDINKAVAKKSGFFIKNTSLFPMLTNLKNEGVIVRDRDKMALKSRVEGGADVMTG